MQQIPQSPTRHFFSLRAQGVETLRGQKGGAPPYQRVLQFLNESQQNNAYGLSQEPGPIVIYPNPTSGLVQIKRADQISGPETIALFDLAGRMVAEHQVLFSHGQGSVTFEHLSHGLYTCKIGNGPGAFYAKLIIAMP